MEPLRKECQVSVFCNGQYISAMKRKPLFSVLVTSRERKSFTQHKNVTVKGQKAHIVH